MCPGKGWQCRVSCARCRNLCQNRKHRFLHFDLAFPYSQDLPLELIGRAAAALAAQYQRPD